jgi:hypothetical protein
MSLVVIWILFILLMSLFDGLEQLNFFLGSGLMLYFTFVYNRIKPIILPPRTTILLLLIPSTLIWYTVFIYNDFLSLTPLTNELFIGLFFVYSCFLIYIFFQISNKRLKNLFKRLLNF